MDVTIATNDLVDEFALADKIINKKPTIPILSGILLDASEGKLTIAATDLEVGLTSYRHASVTVPGRAVVPSRKLFDLVRLLPNTDLRLQADGAAVVATAPTFTAKLPGFIIEDYPTMPMCPLNAQRLPAEAVARAIGRVRFAVTGSDTRYFLAGALFVVADGRMRMIATDGHRLALAESACDGTVPPIILPRKALDALPAILAGDAHVEFSTTAKHAFFRSGSRILLSRLIDGTFPAYKRVIPKPIDARLSTATGPLMDALRRAGALAADARTRAVRFDLRADALGLDADSPEGETAEVVGTTYGGDPIKISLNYVLEFLNAVKTDQVTVEAWDPMRPVVWRTVGGEDTYTYVIMPLRMD